jgi:hypothetical protein
MKHDFAFLETGGSQAPCLDPFAEELGVVNHFVAHAEFWIFVFEGVVAMGAKGHDFSEAIFLEGSGVLGDVFLKEEVIANSPGGVSCAALFVSEAGKGETHFFHQSRESSEGSVGFGV